MNALPAEMSKVRTICTKYGVKSLAVFGSYARGEARSDSDLDMLVSFSGRASLLTLVALERELTELLGRPVDLQTEAGLSPYLRDRILRERQVVYASGRSRVPRAYSGRHRAD
jgi:predicted nucleotidyltransferase